MAKKKSIALDYNEDDIAFVMEITGKNEADSEKLIKEVYTDLEDDEVTIFDILDIIEAETKVKKNNIKTVARAEKPKEKKETKPKPKKVVAEKKEVYDLVFTTLEEKYGENVKKANENKLILVKMGEKVIKIDFVDTKKIKFE